MATAEKWIDVPGLGGAFQFSDKGRVRQMAKIQRAGRHTRMVFVCEVKPNENIAWCDFATGRLGFHLWFNGRYNFVARDDLVAMFGDTNVVLDTSRDAFVIKARNDAIERNRQSQYSPRKENQDGKTE